MRDDQTVNRDLPVDCGRLIYQSRYLMEYTECKKIPYTNIDGL